MIRAAAVVVVALLAGCDTMQQRPTPIVTDVRTIEAPPVVVVAQCVDPADIPEPFVSSFPAGHEDDPRYIKQRVAGIDADLTWLVPRYAKARQKLIECSQPPKEPPK